MANAGRRAGVSGWVALVALLMASTAWADAPTVTLSISNRAGVSRWTLQAAQETVAKVYEEIGVRVVWTDATFTPGRGRLTVVLIPEKDERFFLNRHDASRGVLGFAPQGSGLTYIFCARVSSLAYAAVRSEERVLGRVLTHEVGHLLLPGQGHASAGIMRDRIDYESLDTPRFTAEQGVFIRAFLATPE